MSRWVSLLPCRYTGTAGIRYAAAPEGTDLSSLGDGVGVKTSPLTSWVCGVDGDE
jgi:hypothetical protein